MLKNLNFSLLLQCPIYFRLLTWLYYLDLFPFLFSWNVDKWYRKVLSFYMVCIYIFLARDNYLNTTLKLPHISMEYQETKYRLGIYKEIRVFVISKIFVKIYFIHFCIFKYNVLFIKLFFYLININWKNTID